MILRVELAYLKYFQWKLMELMEMCFFWSFSIFLWKKKSNFLFQDFFYFFNKNNKPEKNLIMENTYHVSNSYTTKTNI